MREKRKEKKFKKELSAHLKEDMTEAKTGIKRDKQLLKKAKKDL